MTTHTDPMADTADPAPHDAAAVARQLAAARELHREWGETDIDELNQLELWERLGRILDGGPQ